MKVLLLSAAASVFLMMGTRAAATTAARHKISLPQSQTHQIIPRATIRAGQDIELRKVQAMLSGQQPKKVVKGDASR